VLVGVQMTLSDGQSSSGRVVGRYIASQGPLPNTVADFWRMVWEQHVHLVLMLTAESEGRRVKCHRYWPQCGQTSAGHEHLTVSCSAEQKIPSATVRDFQLTSDTVGYRDIVYFYNSLWEKNIYMTLETRKAPVWRTFQKKIFVGPQPKPRCQHITYIWYW